MFHRFISGSLILIMPVCGFVWYLDLYGPPSSYFVATLMALVWINAIDKFAKSFDK